jgi:hypothetical protein
MRLVRILYNIKMARREPTQTPNAAFNSNVTAGNAIIVPVSWNAAAGSITNVQDSLGNTYT